MRVGNVAAVIVFVVANAFVIWVWLESGPALALLLGLPGWIVAMIAAVRLRRYEDVPPERHIRERDELYGGREQAPR